MVDIEEMMRTYVFINDPNVKEITTKFGALLVAVGAIAALAWAGVHYAGDDAVPGGDPAASTAEDADGSEHEDCMPETEVAAWQADHPELGEDDYEIQTVDPGIVCIYW